MRKPPIITTGRLPKRLLIIVDNGAVEEQTRDLVRLQRNSGSETHESEEKHLKWQTCEGKDENTNGDDPRHSTVALPELVHQVLEEDPQALDGAVGADLHHEKGHGHSPAPTTIRHFWVNLRTQITVGTRKDLHGESGPPAGRAGKIKNKIVGESRRWTGSVNSEHL